MWYNFETHDAMSDEAFDRMLRVEMEAGKEMLTLLAIARANGWQWSQIAHRPEHQTQEVRHA